MMAELIIIERLFNWPGFGRLLGSILSLGNPSADFLSPPMVAALLTILAGFFLLIDMFATLLARSVDPRLGIESELETVGKMTV
jgi:ABC-type dipeptide/oligopeptide/nickel transport system permease component